MLKRTVAAIVLSTLALNGCENIGFSLSYQHGDKGLMGPPVNKDPELGVVKTNPVDTEASIIQKLQDLQEHQKQIDAITQNWCPKYHPPVLPPAPAAPLDKLNALKPTDTAAINTLTRDHIVDLHTWIDNSLTAERNAYQAYLRTCARIKQPPAM